MKRRSTNSTRRRVAPRGADRLRLRSVAHLPERRVAGPSPRLCRSSYRARPGAGKRGTCRSASSPPSTASPADGRGRRRRRPCRHRADADAQRCAGRRRRNAARHRRARRGRAQSGGDGRQARSAAARRPTPFPAASASPSISAAPPIRSASSAVEDIRATIAAIAAAPRRDAATLRPAIRRRRRIATSGFRISSRRPPRAAASTPRRMPSGAGHDAMAFDKIIPFAMLFVRCRGGVSHNPDEFASPADIDIAARVLSTFLDRIGTPMTITSHQGRAVRVRGADRGALAPKTCAQIHDPAALPAADHPRALERRRLLDSARRVRFRAGLTRITPAIRRRARSFFIRAASARRKFCWPTARSRLPARSASSPAIIS